MSIAIQSSNELDRTVACALEQVSDDELVRSVRPREACTGTGNCPDTFKRPLVYRPALSTTGRERCPTAPPSHVRSHIDFMLTTIS